MSAARRRAALTLLLAGSDPSGGAGLELDLKVHAIFGSHAAALATCVTLQTAVGLSAVTPTSVHTMARPLAALRRDARIAVVQVGMVANRAWIERIGELAAACPKVPFVVDPVFAPTRGERTLPASALALYRRSIVAKATLLTPNALEAAELLGWTHAAIVRQPMAAARALLELGPAAVLLKGGHLASRGAVVDFLCGRFGSHEFVQPRQRGVSPRGTGCALASAISAGVAGGEPWLSAIAAAQRWLARARAGARRYGAGRPYLGLPPRD